MAFGFHLSGVTLGGQTTNGPAYEILVCIAYARKLSSNIHAQLSSGDIYLNLGLSLQLCPYFVHASSGGSDEIAQSCQILGCSLIPSIMHMQLSSGDIHPNLGLGLHLRPYFAYASSEGSGENAWMHLLLAVAMGAKICVLAQMHVLMTVHEPVHDKPNITLVQVQNFQNPELLTF